MKRSPLWALFGLGLTGLGLFFLPRLLTTFWARGHIFRLDQAPERPVAIVFGAGLQRDGRPTLVLRDRVR
ncbi:MAG: SanA protein, partial [Anaerolineales bacterium]